MNGKPKTSKLRRVQLVAIKQPANVRRIPSAGIPSSDCVPPPIKIQYSTSLQHKAALKKYMYVHNVLRE